MNTFDDLLNGASLLAIFTCDSLYIGPNKFKPMELMVFTNKGLRISVAENLIFRIPTKHVQGVIAYFSTTSESMISVKISKTFAAHIKRSILSVLPATTSDEHAKYDRAILLCEQLNASTIDDLRTLFPLIREINEEKKDEVVHILVMPLETQSETIECVDLDADESHALPESQEGEQYVGTKANTEPIDDNRTLLLYQHDEGAITLTVGDYMCLSAEEYLNDKIIDFYLKWLHNNALITMQKRRNVHVFSSYFYHVLSSKLLNESEETAKKLSVAERRYKRVKKWTKNVNIFEKEFIIVPVNENDHWYLVIICFANMLISTAAPQNAIELNENDIAKNPSILIFNSMESTAHYRQTILLREYLNCEFKAKIADSDVMYFTKSTLPGHRVKVPQQLNLVDCGLYVLQYVENFFRTPIKNFNLPIRDLRNWFDAKTIARKRKDIAMLIQRLIDQQHAALGTQPTITTPKIQFPHV